MTTQNNSQEWLLIAATLSCMVVAFYPWVIKLPRKPELPIETDGKVIISTKETFYHARLKPRFSILVAVIAVIFVSLIMFKYDNRLLAIFTFLACLFPIAVPLLDLRIKEVAVVDGGLLISDFSKSITVPFSQVKEVKTGDSRAIAAYVFVEFVSKGVFGKTIYFLPVDRLEVRRILEPLGVKYILQSWK